MHHWSLRDKLQIACIIYQHSIGKLFQLILSILLQICVVNYTKRNPDQYHCSSFHSLIFHWFCYSLTLFNVSTTEPNSVGNFGLLWNNFSEEKKVSLTPSIPRDWWDTKTKAQRERIFVLFPMMYYWHPGGIFSKTLLSFIWSRHLWIFHSRLNRQM